MPPTDSSPLNYSNSGPGILIGCSILALISTVVFVLRVWARRLTRQPLALDDYLCLAALVIQHALLVAAGVMVVKGGLGRDIRITAAENPDSVTFLFQVRTLFLVLCGWLLMEKATTGTLRRRNHLHVQLPADQTIRVGLLLAHVPHPDRQVGLQDHRCTEYCLVHCHNRTGFCTMPSSQGFLAYRASGAANHALS